MIVPPHGRRRLGNIRDCGYHSHRLAKTDSADKRGSTICPTCRVQDPLLTSLERAGKTLLKDGLVPWPGRRQAPTSGGLKSLRYGNLILDPAQKQMGPVFPPAPRSPALVPDDLGDRRARGSFPTASFDPCGSSSTSSAARWSVRTGFHRLVPVLASGPVRRLVLVSSASRLVHSLPPGGSVTATPPCCFGLSVPRLAEAFRLPSACPSRW